MVTRRVLVNGREIEIIDGTTTDQLKRQAGVPAGRNLVSLIDGGNRIMGRGEVVNDEATAFMDIPTFRYGR